MLDLLREQAERTPTQRYQELQKLCQQAETKLARLKRTSLQFQSSVDTSEEKLARLDMDIIEADAIHQDISEEVESLKRALNAIERTVRARTTIASDLRQSAQKLSDELQTAQNQKLEIEKQHDSLVRQVGGLEQELLTIANELSDKKDQLITTNRNLLAANKSLKALLEKDKNFRRNLASEKMKLERERDNVDASKVALKKDIEVRQQLNPKWKLEVPDEPQHFKL